MIATLLPVVGRCKCPNRSEILPLRVVEGPAQLLRECGLLPDTVVATWRCGICKGVVELTARDLHIAA
jgi:hypothetical protein